MTENKAPGRLAHIRNLFKPRRFGYLRWEESELLGYIINLIKLTLNMFNNIVFSELNMTKMAETILMERSSLINHLQRNTLSF